ncbi:LysR family transcriptional regulator [[Clostridium] symbiosum]|uniref:LysR family transcriptional regulator n=1 Tax=Clostridium symbiosum TaxID=1512 RepID=UPI001D064585|nr:LysR family transcriptional regulator [[Clostridium] symbiosum]MCB6607401.1 LysR family transcriptional regulator [[Clostridium] symbiosum]MCB6930043.1 LysR family transcriptional regulator [[Clostridium] symbiosum]
MTQRELIYIKTAADEKSISQAAKKLYIAQPSMSQFIKRIEDSLGTSLFNRTPNGLTLTYAGEKYYQMALQVLKLYDNFEMELSAVNNMQAGRIHLGITSHLGTVVLPKILPGFMERYPSIEVTVTEDTSDRLEALLTAGQVDFIIAHAPKEPAAPLLEYRFLSRDYFLIVAGGNSPLHEMALEPEPGSQAPYPVLDIRLLAGEPFIMLPPSQRIRQVSDSLLRQAGITQPDIKLTVKNFSTAQLLAASGAGVTFIPRQYSKLTSMEAAGSCFSIPARYHAYWDLSIGTSPSSFLSRADLVFIDLMKELFGSTV